MNKVYLVFENKGMFNGSLVVKAFSSESKAAKFAASKAKRQKNKPQYDDWGLCEGVEYIVAKLRVN